MDTRKILAKRLAASLAIGLLLITFLCALVDYRESTSVIGNPALADELPVVVSVIHNVQVVPIRDVELGFHVTWEASIFPGDNNYDGRTDIADITPIAIRFGEEVGDDLCLRKMDWNLNGVIDAGDVDRVEVYYGVQVPYLVIQLRNSDTGAYRLARIVYWHSHQGLAAEREDRCSFEADIQAKPEEWTLRISPVYTPITLAFEGRSISLLPYLQPSSQ